MRRAAAAALTLVMVMSACAARPHAAIQLVLTTGNFEPSVRRVASLVRRFEQAHPGVHVKQVTRGYENITGDLQRALADGTSDVVSVEAPALSVMSSGVAAPVDVAAMGYGSRGILSSKFLPGSLDAFTYKGTLYGIPHEGDCAAMYINEKLFRAAGFDPETQYPRTWEDVLALSQKLVKRDRLGHITRSGFDFTYPHNAEGDPTALALFPMIAQKGGRIVSADGTRSVFDSPAARAIFTLIRDWVFRYRLGGPGAPESFDGFRQGTLAMTVKGPWVEQLLKDQAPDVYANLAVVPFPTFTGAAAPYAPSMDEFGYLVSARLNAAQRRAAWQLVSYLTSDPIGEVETTGIVPPRVEIDAARARLRETVRGLDAFLDDCARPHLTLFDVPRGGEIASAIDDAIVSMASNVDPATAVANASKQIDAILARRP